jgi:hypothetical protein
MANEKWPIGREPNWFEVSSRADDVWRGAQQRFYETYYGDQLYQYPNGTAAQQAQHQLERDRQNYRRMILGWYKKLCLPMTPEQCTPSMVAELLAESWDLGLLHEEWG